MNQTLVISPHLLAHQHVYNPSLPVCTPNAHMHNVCFLSLTFSFQPYACTCTTFICLFIFHFVVVIGFSKEENQYLLSQVGMNHFAWFSLFTYLF